MTKSRNVGRARRKRRNTNRLGIIAITFIVIMLSVVLSTKIYGLHEKNKELALKKAELQDTLDLQEQRSKDLESQRTYVQTNEYIEEKARELGYVYPDEIIYKSSN
jgi:cell division protein DivIC